MSIFTCVIGASVKSHNFFFQIDTKQNVLQLYCTCVSFFNSSRVTIIIYLVGILSITVDVYRNKLHSSTQYLTHYMNTQTFLLTEIYYFEIKCHLTFFQASY